SLPLGHSKLADLVVACLTYTPDTSGALRRRQPNLENDVRDPVLDGFEHLSEHSMSFSLKLDLRVPLRHRAHPDAVFEMVHGVEVVLPRGIVYLHKNVSFQVP